jgi:hypothetical protein
MSVNGVNNSLNYTTTTSTTGANQSKKENKTESVTNEDKAVVYEKSSDVNSKKVYVRDEATIQRLKAEVERHTQSLRELVEKILLKQGKAYTNATDMYAMLREGKLDVDPETRAQAQRDIAEDGYWGVKQTSDRLVSFAKALTGGDPSKVDMIIDAVKKGYEAAEKAWGDKLPDISRRTLEETLKKLEAWRDGTEEIE